jgi:hypothetical protein
MVHGLYISLPALEYEGAIVVGLESKIARCSINAPSKIEDATSTVVFYHLISPRYRRICYLRANSSTDSSKTIKTFHRTAGEIDD